ncbi:5-formyltetrahydrofolate cyclo-ligase [Salinibacterium sp. SYSU T00001]|uniref:5-formyltetrahydrofolate cyclo-ligase n=1 Tax=Homoserinimonas sedimenticola TaxID=2986805 RepID=UPI002235F00F|nr:5-formyltetrahydrofolate cyclo-ligase [Salinibacterium sedimenticola]MCW4386270.1 5-formyltetrahydrofolate cyclo-ligase [Salinibacterium sedimenticola]
MSDELPNLKRAMRAELRERRRIMTSSEVENATEQFTLHLTHLTERLAAKYVAAYLPNPDEPNIRPWLDWAHTRGIRVLLPISRDDGLLDWVVGDGESEVQGQFGVPEAVGEVLGPIAINEVDLIIVPAASVDRTGMRMGWGRGYYDRMLGSMEQRPPVYAVVFDSELVDEVPGEVHDRPVDGAVTPSGIVELQPST